MKAFRSNTVRPDSAFKVYCNESKCTNVAWNFPFNIGKNLETLKIVPLHYRVLSSATSCLLIQLCYYWNQWTAVGGSRQSEQHQSLWGVYMVLCHQEGSGGLSDHTHRGQRRPGTPAAGACSFGLRMWFANRVWPCFRSLCWYLWFASGFPWTWPALIRVWCYAICSIILCSYSENANFYSPPQTHRIRTSVSEAQESDWAVLSEKIVKDPGK